MDFGAQSGKLPDLIHYDRPHFFVNPDGSVLLRPTVLRTPEAVGQLEDERLDVIVDRAVPQSMFDLTVRLSNRCPLRCRMCGPRDSSRWSVDWPALERTGREFYRRGSASAPERGTDPVAISAGAFRNLAEARGLWSRLNVIELDGGEPFAEPLNWTLLESILASGFAETLKFTTSALDLPPERLAIAARFSHVGARASAEATGDLYTYIRGRAFADFERGVATLRTLPSIRLVIACAASAYNVFGISDLWTWSQSNGFYPDEFEVTVVDRPRFLAPWALPIETRTRALKLLREAGEGKFGPSFDALERALERDDRAEDETRIQMFQEFVEFTTDLDRLRGEQLPLAAPSLFQLEEPISARRGGLSWPQRR